MDIISNFIFIVIILYTLSLGVILLAIKLIRERTGEYYLEQQKYLNKILTEQNAIKLIFDLFIFTDLFKRCYSQLNLLGKINYLSWRNHQVLKKSFKTMHRYCEIMKNNGSLSIDDKKNLHTIGKNIVFLMDNIDALSKKYGSKIDYEISQKDIELLQYLSDEFKPKN